MSVIWRDDLKVFINANVLLRVSVRYLMNIVISSIYIHVRTPACSCGIISKNVALHDRLVKIVRSYLLGKHRVLLNIYIDLIISS